MFGVMNASTGGESTSAPGQDRGQPQDDSCVFINVVYANDKEKSGSQNPKHERFLRKRKFLERKGLLRSKTEPYKQRRNTPTAGQSTLPLGSGGAPQRPKVVFRSALAPHPHAKEKPRVEPAVSAPSSGGSGTQRSKKRKKSKPGEKERGINTGAGPASSPAPGGPAPSCGDLTHHFMSNAKPAPLPSEPGVSEGNLRAISLLRGLNIPALAPALIPPSKYAAIDCEMVGGGPQGQVSMLARCSVVSYDGDVLFDQYVKPESPVTCYRTRWSGIRPADLVNATPFQEAKKQVARLLHGRVVVGHAVHHDFQSLAYSHPPAQTRDTQKIPLLNLKGGFEVQRTVSLKNMSKTILNHDIQTGRNGHSSLEDARATMRLYRAVAGDWEKVLASGYNFWAAFKGAP